MPPRRKPAPPRRCHAGLLGGRAAVPCISRLLLGQRHGGPPQDADLDLSARHGEMWPPPCARIAGNAIASSSAWEPTLASARRTKQLARAMPDLSAEWPRDTHTHTHEHSCTRVPNTGPQRACERCRPARPRNPAENTGQRLAGGGRRAATGGQTCNGHVIIGIVAERCAMLWAV